MTRRRFRLLNVFAETRFGGNPLAVFEDGSGLDAHTMQAIARQFNLSETTFILPAAAAGAAARVRIFTPDFEMPFAGHPLLGTAHVIRDLAAGGDRLLLETGAGLVPVNAEDGRWELEARLRGADPVPETRFELASALNIWPDDILAEARVVDTGSRQMVVPLASHDAVARCRPDYERFRHIAQACGMESFLILVWAPDPSDPVTVHARFFFPQGGAVREDPATGSACANLGGWFIVEEELRPLSRRVLQGEAVGRPSVLSLKVDESGTIRVAGRVIEIGRGEIEV